MHPQGSTGALCAVPACSKHVMGAGLCSMHYSRKRRYGSVDHGRLPESERFCTHVTKGDGCWPWTAATDRDGYGFFKTASRKMVKAHRYAWTLAHGPIPVGRDIMHTCDNPPCVRDSHLQLGTNQLNTLDRETKGRGAKGERIASAKMTSNAVRLIRERVAGGCVQAAIAREYGVSATAVSRAVLRRTWQHVQ